MNHKQKHIARQVEFYKHKLLVSEKEISLTKILSSDECQSIINGCREFRERIYPPITTLFMFIKQVMHPDKSCKNIVAGMIAEKMLTGENAISNNTGPYCKARAWLPESSVKALLKEVGSSAIRETPNVWKWRGKEVKGADGTTLLMPDTKENQSIFPQHGGQEQGVGFPITPVVAILSLSTGVVLDYAMEAFQGKGTGESSLLRSMLSCINSGDVFLGDAYFPNFFLMCDLKERGADGVFRGQGQRKYDFRKGVMLGTKDHIVEWYKPAQPFWMNDEQYQAYPDYIRIREFKVNGKVYVTTFLCQKKYCKHELAWLYGLRWQCEITLRNIKSVMRMDMLSCKTPTMIRKETSIHFLAYNFIRIIMAEACSKYSGIPNQASFKGTVQLINQFMPFLLKGGDSKKETYAKLLSLIVKNKVGNRPGRSEPRMVKRRRKPFPLLHRSRMF